ncbi:Hpt domain-containing protein [Thiohalospira halophila DSM 15071]|uniref:Hpt domain-containing protein n=1 Tax=Thiohalospira halophila DSM 15071 TaxID=1123397 RepID=A0A1I1RG94_9GAMM|nr:Hpt domain-containing protein [Thiohalospira halophila]SFD33147.1 Hpt domain-containing protein [Thiohalospira halophila DSM 15071]
MSERLEALVADYRARLPGRVAALEEAARRLAAGEEGARGEIRAEAHRLKGSGASYGLEALSRTAGALERAAREGDADAVAAALQDLRAAITPP